MRERRQLFGYSQKELGIKAGIDQFVASPRINQYETNKHVPDYNTVERLAVVLEISPAYFYADDDELANLISLFSEASKTKKKQVITVLKK